MRADDEMQIVRGPAAKAGTCEDTLGAVCRDAKGGGTLTYARRQSALAADRALGLTQDQERAAKLDELLEVFLRIFDGVELRQITEQCATTLPAPPRLDILR
jgi:hypothetical protein